MKNITIKDIRESSMQRERNLFHSEIQDFFSGIDLEQILFPGARVLELGCGSGLCLFDLASLFGITPFGVDIVNYFDLEEGQRSFNGRNYQSINKPKQNNKKQNDIGTNKGFIDILQDTLGKAYDQVMFETSLRTKVNYIMAQGEHLPFNDGSFDFVYSFQAIRYMSDKLEVIKEAHRVLRPGGTALLDLQVCASDYITGPKIIPNIRSIIEHFPNKGQLHLAIVGVEDALIHYVFDCYRLAIRKTDDAQLDFPPLIRPATFFDGNSLYDEGFLEPRRREKYDHSQQAAPPGIVSDGEEK